ncbi:ADP-ribosylglycohydrolase family protein [Haloarcula halophila]|uniref:ADP-ribosylglycohydrolase family protein n=1 Tax=Haloarcula TaxID=2237 RepID=UPI00300FCCD7
MDALLAAKGAPVGLACGDALSCPVEFQSPAQITDQYGTLTEVVGYGTHGTAVVNSLEATAGIEVDAQ